MRHLPGLDQRQRLEQLVHGAVAPREDDEPRGIFHEHRLADEEIAEVDGALDVGVEPLLERQLDIAADRQAVALLAAAIRRFHDPGPAPGNDREALLGEQPRGFHGMLVVGIVRRGTRRPEYRDGAVDVGERVEPLDEFAHDPEHAPRVRPREGPALAGNLGEESFVLSDRRAWRAARALRHGRPARYRRKGRGARAPGARRRRCRRRRGVGRPPPDRPPAA